MNNFVAPKPAVEVINHLDSLSSATRRYDNCKTAVADKTRELKISEEAYNNKVRALQEAEKALEQAAAQVRHVAKSL